MALVCAIAYDTTRDLGAAYDRTLKSLSNDDWCCFLDHDAMFTTDDWDVQLLDAVRRHRQAGLFAAVTNRIGTQWQVVSSVDRNNHDLRYHRRIGRELRDEHGATAVDVSNRSPISGVVMCGPVALWRRVGFAHGFFGVDNQLHRDVVRAGKRVYLLPGLYVYHWYRGDGVSHAPGAPRARRV